MEALIQSENIFMWYSLLDVATQHTDRGCHFTCLVEMQKLFDL